MVVMESPTPKRVVTWILLALGAYVVLLPLWWQGRTVYARAVCFTETEIVMPAMSFPGSVRVQPRRWTLLIYTLPDARTGGWGQIRQRLLDFSDIPLALALALSCLLLNWRRRCVVGLASVLMLFLCHLGLVTWTAMRLAGVLRATDLPLAVVDRLLHDGAQTATGFGNISTVITLTVVMTLTAVLGQWHGCQPSHPSD